RGHDRMSGKAPKRYTRPAWAAPGVSNTMPCMRIEVLDFVAGARAARGVAVIIDVFRAFSVACYAAAGGAARIIPVADAGEALALRRAHPDWLAAGERHARRLPGFDFGNSPTEITQADLRG